MSLRLESLRKAIVGFRAVLEALETDISRDAAIQRFEFCFELALKSIQERARVEGLDCQSPKGCFKLASKSGWIPVFMALKVLVGVIARRAEAISQSFRTTTVRLPRSRWSLAMTQAWVECLTWQFFMPMGASEAHGYSRNSGNLAQKDWIPDQVRNDNQKKGPSDAPD